MENININEIDGVKIGNAQDYNGGTGITVILCPNGARAGVDIRGGGPALHWAKNYRNTCSSIIILGISDFYTIYFIYVYVFHKYTLFL